MSEKIPLPSGKVIYVHELTVVIDAQALRHGDPTAEDFF